MKITVYNNLYNLSPSVIAWKKPNNAVAEISTQLENTTSPVTSVCLISINCHQFRNFSNENLQYLGLRKTLHGARGPHAS